MTTERTALDLYLDNLAALDLPAFHTTDALKRDGRDNELIEALLPMVLGIAKWYASPDSDAYLDLVQTGNLAAVMAVQTWDPDKPLALTTWAIRSIRRDIRREARRISQAGFTHLDIDDLSGWSVDAMESVHLVATLYGVDDHTTVKKLLAELTDDERHIIKWAFVDGLTFNDIADKLKKTPSFCYKLLQNTVNKLKNVGNK